MTDEADFERAACQWFLRDLKYEGMVGDKMRAAFTINSMRLPHALEALIERLNERETTSARDLPIEARTMRWPAGDISA